MYQIQVVRGNLLNVDADVFCFSANSNLLPSIGINKNIFYTAGDELLKECEVIPLIPKGEVYVSSGYNTQAKYLFHCLVFFIKPIRVSDEDMSKTTKFV